MPTIVTAKFQYGPLAMASLSKEMVSMCLLPMHSSESLCVVYMVVVWRIV